MIGEANIENDIDAIEPGLGEKNVDELVIVNECDDEQSFSRDIETITEPNEVLPMRMLFAYITRKADVSTFTGIEGPEMFKAIFEMLKPKAQVMTNWDGHKRH